MASPCHLRLVGETLSTTRCCRNVEAGKDSSGWPPQPKRRALQIMRRAEILRDDRSHAVNVNVLEILFSGASKRPECVNAAHFYMRGLSLASDRATTYVGLVNPGGTPTGAEWCDVAGEKVPRAACCTKKKPFYGAKRNGVNCRIDAAAERRAQYGGGIAPRGERRALATIVRQFCCVPNSPILGHGAWALRKGMTWAERSASDENAPRCPKCSERNGTSRAD